MTADDLDLVEVRLTLSGTRPDGPGGRIWPYGSSKTSLETWPPVVLLDHRFWRLLSWEDSPGLGPSRHSQAVYASLAAPYGGPVLRPMKDFLAGVDLVCGSPAGPPTYTVAGVTFTTEDILHPDAAEGRSHWVRVYV